MPVVQIKGIIHPLCHEHHVPMRQARVLLNAGSQPKRIYAYACPEPCCLIHYSVSQGYFTAQAGIGIRREMMPSVSCPNDGLLMYLAEIGFERRSFRLWKCEKCEEWVIRFNAIYN